MRLADEQPANRIAIGLPMQCQLEACSLRSSKSKDIVNTTAGRGMNCAGPFRESKLKCANGGSEYNYATV